jgi:general stress protein 26
MELNYSLLENEFIQSIESNHVWILATSLNNITTARSISIINNGITIYFQTNKDLLKYRQIIMNHHVALCYSNISIEAIAEEIGNWENPQNIEIKEKYIETHRASFERYGKMQNEVVIKIAPMKVTIWKYIEGRPFRDYLLVNERRAFREEYLVH